MAKGISLDKLKVAGGPATLRVLNREAMVVPSPTLPDLNFSVLLSGEYEHDALIERAYRHVLVSGLGDHAAKSAYDGLKQYSRFCHQEQLPLNTRDGLVEFCGYLRTQLQAGTYTADTCQTYFNRIVTLLDALDLPAKRWTHRLGKFQSGPGTEAYDDQEMRKVIRALMAVFNQLVTQINDEPNKPFYIFHEDHQVVLKPNKRGSRADAFNKIAYAVYYLTTYFTAANQAPLTQAIRTGSVRFQRDGSRFLKVDGIKWRAGKEVDYTFGVTKHARRMLQAWLHLSEPYGAEPLFFILGQQGGQPKPLDSKLIAKFAQWLQKQFNLQRSDGTPLVITARGLRATARHRFMARTQDPLKVAQVMQHSPKTGDRHYGAGNPHQNLVELQATAHAMTHSAQHQAGVEAAKAHAKEAMQIDVLPYDEFVRRHSDSTTTEIGTRCKTPFGDKAEQYTRRARKAGLIASTETLACADFIQCFQCAHCALVEELDDLWCVLSFRAALVESQAFHISVDHHQQNFGQVISAIDQALARVSNQAVLNRARQKAERERHPLWPEHTDVLSVLGGSGE